MSKRGLTTDNTNPSSMNPPRVFDVPGASAYSGLPPWTLRDLVWKGFLPTVKLPDGRGGVQRRMWIAREDLDALILKFKEVEPVG